MSSTKQRIAALAAVLATSFSCHAIGQTTPKADKLAFCEKHAELAGLIMTGRQHGREMADVVKTAPKRPDGTVNPILQMMIVAAYEVPRFTTVAMQQRQITDFKNEQYLACLKGTKAIR